MRRLPEATSQDQEEAEAHAEPQRLMEAKGLPARVARRGKAVVLVSIKRVWHFMLEAKGLRQSPLVSYKIQKIWQKGPERTNLPTPLIPPSNKEKTEDYFLEQIKKFPKDLDGYNKLGQFYIEQNSYDDAKNVYDYLTKHDPAQAEYWARLGFSQVQLEQYDVAIDSYNKALGLDSSHPNRYYNLALAHNGLQEWDSSAKALRKALELEPNNVKYMHALADVYNRMNRPEQAREISGRIERMDGIAKAGD